MKRIVIAGCGFGGLRVAEQLVKQKDVEIVAIDSSNCHTFVPGLYEVATGEVSIKEVCEPFSVLFIRRGIKFINESIKDINIKSKILKTETKVIKYDYLVLAIGSEVNYFNVPGLKENSYPLKTREDGDKIYEHVTKTVANMKDKQLHRFVVLGGGVTGTELAAELRDYLDIICRRENIPKEKFSVMIVQAMDGLLPGFNESVRKFCEHYMADHNVVLKLNSPVVSVKKGILVLKSGEIIKADTVFWCGGLKVNQLVEKIGLSGDEFGVKVNTNLQSVDDKSIYVLGDCMNYIDPRTNEAVYKTAQNALKQARVVSFNLCKAINGKKKLKSYKPKTTPVLISLGKRRAIFVWKKLWFRGKWMLKVKDWVEKNYMWKIRL
jgi:NADH:ubiquinone reductase (H+-translocating)